MRKERDFYKILVIEDNMGDFILVRDFLEEMILAPEIIHTSSFKEAYHTLSESNELFQAIFLDLTLPDKNGEELIKEVILASKEVPVIVLTGYTDTSFAIKSLSLGASDYLLKDELSATTLFKSLTYNIERNKNLRTLKESELRYSDLFQLSPQPMWVYDVDTLQFLDVNRAAINHYGYSKMEFLSMTVMAIQATDNQWQEDGQSKTSPSGSLFLQGLSHQKTKTGEIINVDIRSNTIYFNGKNAKVVLAIDVTEKLRHNKIIENQNRRLREIAWTQSHVVRAPLSRMLGLIDLIKTGIITQEEIGEFLTHLQSSALEIDGIIRDIVRKTEQLAIDEKRESSENNPS
nr:response regulator [Cytophagales bacterium]